MIENRGTGGKCMSANLSQTHNFGITSTARMGMIGDCPLFVDSHNLDLDSLGDDLATILL
jgi:hypothetical protein